MTSATLTARDNEQEYDFMERDLTDSEPPVELPLWFEPLLRDSAKFLLYDANWDSYGGRSIDTSAFASAFALLAVLSGREPQLRRPMVMPTPFGGVAFEWNTPDGLLELEVNHPARGVLYFESHRTPDEFETEFTSIDIPLHYVRALHVSAR